MIDVKNFQHTRSKNGSSAPMRDLSDSIGTFKSSYMIRLQTMNGEYVSHWKLYL